MPRILLPCALVLLASGCFFEADYAGPVRCGADQRCPTDRPICHQSLCVASLPDDALTPDVPADARMPAFTCGDPGRLPATGGMVMGTTAASAETTNPSTYMSSSCGGFVNNGPDHVYRIDDLQAGQLEVEIIGTLKAYVLDTCLPAPNTPVCKGTVRATDSVPIMVSVSAGTAYIVVDEEDPTATGAAYTLTITPP